MTRPTHQLSLGPGFLLGMLAAMSIWSVGCAPLQLSSLKMPAMNTPKLSQLSGLAPGANGESPRYDTMGSGVALPTGSFTEEVYHKVREAKANDSIVLQVVGDRVPVRVLPLPPATGSGAQGRSVFLSTLLKQTGIGDRFGRMEAALYRHSADSMEGIRMDVQFADRGTGEVRPESDYALRAGDRLVIREAPGGGLGSLVDMALQR
ncbi:hypothetical protein [Rhodopirellula halodulae]|uniref:hypothetical protein n=1 Tax=Rhodopirellula halodulae TaxID=2894198 RepID=UPI001E2D4BF4|nr:hypothetical protein [Rhodopirellula sp. JC737]MCC9658435.1 hypothetical protein [Rhodopirellula sp. JC737]